MQQCPRDRLADGRTAAGHLGFFWVIHDSEMPTTAGRLIGHVVGQLVGQCIGQLVFQLFGYVIVQFFGRSSGQSVGHYD